jgi:hypothetical protein
MPLGDEKLPGWGAAGQASVFGANYGRSAMGWFRTNQCGVARLAVFALACQLMFAFGHVHLGKPGGVPEALAIAADIGNASGDMSPPAPQKKPTGLADVFCPVCASINLASTLVTPASPVIVPPIAAAQHLRWSVAATDLAASDHLLFDARGPPHT